MTLLLRIITAAALLLVLAVVRRILQQRQLPPPPWRLPAAALVLLAVGDPLAALLPAPARELVLRLDGLLGSLAVVVLVIWGVLQLPAALGLIRPLPQILRDLATLLIGAMLTVITLRQAGVNLVGLVTTSAVLTAMIGLAAQETLKDLFGGLSMQIGSSFRVGDWVELGDHRGTVESIRLMNTVLRNLEGAQLVVPNSQAAAAVARRCRPGEPVGHRFTVGLAYSHPPEAALRLLGEVLERHPMVLAAPAPQVWIQRFAESSVEYELLLFQREPGDGPQWRLRGELLQQIWYALQREGHNIPFPVVELRRPPSEAGGPDPWDAAQRARLLAANPLFSALEPEQRATLAALTRCLRFGPGETVVQEGERGDCLYQVVQGTVEVLRGSTAVAALNPGAVFGEMTLLTDDPRNATVRSRGETVLLEVERQDLAPLLETSPGLLEQLGALVSRRQQELERLSDAATTERTGWLVERMRQLFGL